MASSHNARVFWFCAVLALAISLGAVGVVIVYDALILNPEATGRLSLRPGGGLLAILLSVGLLAIVFRVRWLATAMALATVASGLLFTALPVIPGAEQIGRAHV